MRLLFIILAVLFFNASNGTAQNEIAIDTCNFSLDVFSSKNIETLKIKSQHAKINIYNWDKESISVESTVKILSEKIVVVEELLALITAEAEIKKQSVEVNTILSEDFSSTVPYLITHNIFIPKNIELDIKNSHGLVVIPEVTKGVTLNLSYCELKLDKVFADTEKSYLNLSYSNAVLNQIGNCSINSNSSKISISQCDTVTLKSSFSDISISNNVKINGQTEIDKIAINNTNQIYLKGENSHLVIDNFNADGKFELKNGSLLINNSSADINSLTISNNNTKTNIHISPNASFILNGEIENGILNYPNPNDINFIRETNKTSFSGTIGIDKNTNSKVILFNKNQNITFK